MNYGFGMSRGADSVKLPRSKNFEGKPSASLNFAVPVLFTLLKFSIAAKTLIFMPEKLI